MNETTEAIKQREGKVRFELVPPHAELEIAKVFTCGADKYLRHGYLVGVPQSLHMDAAKRHINAHQRGENLDPESGLNHLAHAVACLTMIIENQHRHGKAVDDRISNMTFTQDSRKDPEPEDKPEVAGQWRIAGEWERDDRGKMEAVGFFTGLGETPTGCKRGPGDVKKVSYEFAQWWPTQEEAQEAARTAEFKQHVELHFTPAKR